MCSFLIRLKTISDENLKSYIIRTANENMIVSIYNVCTAVGLTAGKGLENFSMIKNQNISLEKLSGMTNKSIDSLKKVTFYNEFGRYYQDRTNEVNTIFRFGLKTKYNQVCTL
ncbi:TniQ family protein [Paenibacillus sp. SYP-B3998]|uniref:TniQ family protein n=1 Tax=Paenibacillus sp. SYP-B3998 TaxID=2678564 RepID=UPI0013D22BCA|nr:TniQ family protein [Paenibacillus sp. SYP-B3998]